MKNWKVSFNALFTICLICSLVSCNNNPTSVEKSKDEHADEHSGHEHTYACPMHPEVTGHEGDKCSKCGMDLVHSDPQSAAKNYKMEFRKEPENLSAQQSGVLYFTPKDKGNEAAQVPLDIIHEKKIHLIVVSNDLSYFDHVHPEYQVDGSYKLEAKDKAAVSKVGLGQSTTQFPNGGEYTLFADYMPTGGAHQVEKIATHIEGATVPSLIWKKEDLVAEKDGFTMTLKPEGGVFFTNQTSHIDAPLMLKGKQVKTSDLDDFLGAKAHMVVIGVDDLSYLHVHPEVHEEVLDLHAYFEKSGYYRGWIQFSYKGELHTMDFVIHVEAGEQPSTETQHTHNRTSEADHKH